MTWEETPKDLEAYQAALDAQAASGVDSRIAEGRARSKAVRTWRAANPEEAAKLEKAPGSPQLPRRAATAGRALPRRPLPLLPLPWAPCP